jgi:hypothetical protein
MWYLFAPLRLSKSMRRHEKIGALFRGHYRDNHNNSTTGGRGAGYTRATSTLVCPYSVPHHALTLKNTAWTAVIRAIAPPAWRLRRQRVTLILMTIRTDVAAAMTAQAAELGIPLPGSDDELESSQALLAELHIDGALPADRRRLTLLTLAAHVVGRTLLEETDRTDDGVTALRLSTLANFLAGPGLIKRHEDHAVLAATYHLLGMDDEATAELHAADTAAKSSGDDEEWSAVATLAPGSQERDHLLRNLPWFAPFTAHAPSGVSEEERHFDRLTDAAVTEDGVDFPTLARSVADEVITTESLDLAVSLTEQLIGLLPVLEDAYRQDLTVDTADILADQDGGELLAVQLYEDLASWHEHRHDVTGQIAALTGAGAAYLKSNIDNKLEEAFSYLDAATTRITPATPFATAAEAESQLGLLYLQDSQPKNAVETLTKVAESHPYESLADAAEVRSRARLLVVLSEAWYAAAEAGGPQRDHCHFKFSEAAEEARRGFSAIGEGAGYETTLDDFDLLT